MAPMVPRVPETAWGQWDSLRVPGGILEAPSHWESRGETLDDLGCYRADGHEKDAFHLFLN